MKAKPKAALTPDQQKLVEEHIGLVDSLAARRATRSIPVEDRRQNGVIGLIDAARSFDPAKEARFHVYAHHRILGAMLDAERAGEGVNIRVPRGEWDRLDDRGKHKSQPHLRLFFARSDHDPIGDCRPDKTIEIAAEEDDQSIDEERLQLMVGHLGGKQAEVMRLYYWFGWTMKAIGRRLGLSEGRVSQMHSDAIERLRANPKIREVIAV